MGEEDTRQVAKLIVRTLGSIGPDSAVDHAAMSAIGDEVRQLSRRFPVPGLDDE